MTGRADHLHRFKLRQEVPLSLRRPMDVGSAGWPYEHGTPDRR